MDKIIQIEVNYFESHYDDQFVSIFTNLYPGVHHVLYSSVRVKSRKHSSVRVRMDVYELSKDKFLEKIISLDNVKWIGYSRQGRH